MFNAEKVKNQCVEWIRNFFEENGKGCNAVIGISGGKDSSVAAALCVEALGKDRVIGVLMPCGVQHDIDMSTNSWGGGNCYEGGADSIYTGWTNAPISIVIALELLNKNIF